MKADGIAALAAACAKCGSCRSVCTLYPERKSERAVARGKIALVEAGARGDGGRPEALQEALADCLLCGRCERSCPNEVPVEEILVRGRAALAEELGLPAWKRILFGRAIDSPAARGAARLAGAAGQRLLLRRVPTASGLHYRFPEAFGLSGRTLPALPRESLTGSPLPGEAERGEVTLFAGCVFDQVLPEVGRAAFETIRRSGKSVSLYRGGSCCGLPALVSGDRAAALGSAEENLRRLSASGEGPIVFPCGSCLAMFRRNLFFLLGEDHPLRPAAERVAARCVDYAGFLVGTGALDRIPRGARFAGPVGYHDPCHLSGTLGKGEEARELLRRTAGGAFREMEGASLCCGYGGTFNVRDYPTSGRIGENKIRLARRGGTAVIATACSGCILQLRDMAARTEPSLRVAHLAELVFQAITGR
ncbi:MAG: (Fe-S)-binding protein [Deltaproteobacteria bacterium]